MTRSRKPKAAPRVMDPGAPGLTPQGDPLERHVVPDGERARRGAKDGSRQGADAERDARERRR
ncbi:MAG TPA: hypothetical protein VFS40_10670 [Gemmatimonadales bacterium]|nr:hypothetical protein [Gemmatimonadales bacterium]